MIILDTHIWIWWVHGAPQLPDAHRELLEAQQPEAGEVAFGVSAISCWEVAKLVELQRLRFPLPVVDWLAMALSFPGLHLLPLTPQIAAASTQLPQPFHQDPADQIIVATAREHAAPLMTVDRLIRRYPHVRSVP